MNFRKVLISAQKINYDIFFQEIIAEWQFPKFLQNIFVLKFSMTFCHNLESMLLKTQIISSFSSRIDYYYRSGFPNYPKENISSLSNRMILETN